MKYVGSVLSGVMDESVVKNAEAARAAALAANDAKALDACLAERLVFVHSSGTLDNKASLLEKIEQGRIVYHAVNLQPTLVQSLADDAWALWGRMDAQIVVAGAMRQVSSSYVTVWVQQLNGTFQLVLHQGTSLPL